MAPFMRGSVEDHQRLDWQILRNGAVSLYYDREVFEESCEWFRQQTYQVYIFDASHWKTPFDFYNELALALHIENCMNLDALSDCLVDIDVPYEGGCVLCFQHFDRFARRHHSFAQDLLDVIHISSRLHLLHGFRFLALIQLDIPDITFEPVGARPVILNPIEWNRQFKQNFDRIHEHHTPKKRNKLNEN